MLVVSAATAADLLALAPVSKSRTGSGRTSEGASCNKKDEFSEGRAMNRRAFLKKAATTGGALAAAGLHGVKFAGHYTAGAACTPARGTIVTGLYTQQSWELATILDSPTTTVSAQPVLHRDYPTYGKLLRQAGYQTPYIGKWHLSIPH